MRHHLLAFALLVTVAAPVAGQSGTAQSGAAIDRRLERIERELRAVQRRVFPSGAGMTVEPEIGAAQPGNLPSGMPATSALNDITARLDTLEAQLRVLTGQVEEGTHRMVLAEQAMASLRASVEGRLAALERPVPAADSAAAETAPSTESTSAAADPGEESYVAGFRLWNAGKFTEAQTALEAMIKRYPKHPRSSYAQNLLGRAYLDGGKPATAAKVLLGNYESNRNGDRAQDSLFYLGQALTRLNRLPDACKVYDELEAVYGARLRAALKQDLPKGRAAAKCR